MIIFGTRGVTSTLEKGDFLCPACCSHREYAHKRVRRFFTLYFLPVLPLDVVGEYVECASCGNTYREEVLLQGGAAPALDVEAEFQRAIKRVMSIMVLADGEVDESELRTMAAIYGKLVGRTLPAAYMREEVERARRDGKGVADYLRDVGPYLNDAGKEMIVRAAYHVAAADGEFQAEEQKLLVEAARALEMSEAHLRGVLAGERTESPG